MYKTHKITEEKFESIINVHYDETILSPTYKLYIKDVITDADELTNLKLPDTSEYVMFPSYINYDTGSSGTESSVLIYDKTLNKLHYYTRSGSGESPIESCKTYNLSSDFEDDKIMKIVTNDTELFVLTESGNLYRMVFSEGFVVEPFIDTISATDGPADGPADDPVDGSPTVVDVHVVDVPVVETTCSDDDSSGSGNTYPDNCTNADVQINLLYPLDMNNINDIAMSATCLYVLFDNNELKYIASNINNTNSVVVKDIVGEVKAIASDFESTFCVYERKGNGHRNEEIHIVHDNYEVVSVMESDYITGVLPDMRKSGVNDNIKLLCRKNWCGFIEESKCHLCDVSGTLTSYSFDVDTISDFDNKTIHLVKIVENNQEVYTLENIKDKGSVSFSPNDIAAGIDSDRIYHLSKQEATSNRSPPRTLWKTTKETATYDTYISRTRILDGLTNIIAMFPSFIDETEEVFLLDSSHRLYRVNGIIKTSNEITFDTTRTDEKFVKVVTNNVKAYVLTTKGNIYPIDLTNDTVDTTSASADRVTSGDAIDFALSSETNQIVYIDKKGILYQSSISIVNTNKFLQIIGHPDSQYMYLLGASDGKLYRYLNSIIDEQPVGATQRSKNVSLLYNGDYYGTYNNTGVYILSTSEPISTIEPLEGFKSASIMKADSTNYLVGIDNSNNLVRIDLSDGGSLTDRTQWTPIKNNVSLFAGKNIKNIFYLPNGDINQCPCELTKDDCNFCDTTDFENDIPCRNIMNGLNELILNSCNPPSG
jgi:hypothetical protein